MTEQLTIEIITIQDQCSKAKYFSFGRETETKRGSVMPWDHPFDGKVSSALILVYAKE